MVIHIRDSSFGHYVGEAAKAWEQVPHAVNLTMCTDDVEPDDVLKRGHMNRVVRLAIEAGIPAPLAIRYATLNGALRYRNYELGAIGAGYLADLVPVDSLERMQVQEVYVEGRPPFVGVLKGLGIRSCAHGTTVAHDSHNMVIAGTSTSDMLLVARTLAEQGGGFALADGGSIIATVALPLAGLMTPEPVEAVGPRVEAYNAKAAALGIVAGTRSSILSLAGIALPVIPEVKITDLGLVHVTSQQIVPLFPTA